MRLEGYSGYEIFPETGKVWSYRKNRYLNCYHHRSGYINLYLYDDKGGRKLWRLHRLIWEVVNGEIPKDKEINHLDENKENNAISNLSLVSHLENMEWGTRIERITAKNVNGKCSKPLVAFNDNELIYFPSLMEAKRQGFKSAGNISQCCKGRINKCYNYEWKYFDDFKLNFLDKYLADWWEGEMEKAA